MKTTPKKMRALLAATPPNKLRAFAYDVIACLYTNGFGALDSEKPGDLGALECVADSITDAGLSIKHAAAFDPASAPAIGAHTPGPLTVETFGGYYNIRHGSPADYTARVFGLADANLYAAAPDLLAAADKLLTDWAAGRNLTESAQMLSRAQAKAEGRATGGAEDVNAWTTGDAAAAIAQGWVLTEANDGLCIQRDDDKCAFKTDADALRYVKAQAKAGSGLHKRALAEIAKAKEGKA